MTDSTGQSNMSSDNDIISRPQPEQALQLQHFVLRHHICMLSLACYILCLAVTATRDLASD